MPTPKPRNRAIAEPVDSLPPDQVLFGRSAAMQEIRALAEKVCRTDAPVLLCGGGGTGKEAIARWIHQHSPFAGGQFVKVNCAAIPSALLESELFGFEKGAFTGAHVSKPGRVELAQDGTLFLDEIADLESGLQAHLLQFLQDGSFSRIGAVEERSARTRLICASNKDLEREVEAGAFRADLYYRINVVRMNLPPLRERSEDIPLLADYFLAQFQEKFGKTTEALNRGTLQHLQSLDWPGNIRQFSNDMARHVLLGGEASENPRLLSEPLHARCASASTKANIPLKQLSKEAVRDREKAFILETLKAHQWNRRKSAAALKISYRTLIYKIRDAGIAGKSAKPSAAALKNNADRRAQPDGDGLEQTISPGSDRP